MSQRYFLAITTVVVGASGFFVAIESKETIVRARASLAEKSGAEKSVQAVAVTKPSDREAAAAHATGTDSQAGSLEKIPYQASAQLARYDRIKQKVFLSEDERKEKAMLLHDEQLLRSFKSLLLKDSSFDRSLQADQDRALDLLYEALQGEESPAAYEVLQAVVADAQVENPDLNPATRENLAGVKGEVIYHWTAIHPEKSQDVQALLPGPTSRKIWDNVMKLQDANLTESKGEVAGSY